MTRHDPPTVDQIRDAIHASTPCNCTPQITIRRTRGARTKLQATHQPGCPVRQGHQRIYLEDQS